MSGKTKRIIYYIASAGLLLLAVAGVVLLAYFGARASSESAAFTVGILICFAVCLMIFPLHELLHEAGHALGGLLCGMRVLSLSFGIYRFDWRSGFSVGVQMRRDANGATAMLPRGGKKVRGKLIFSLLSGAAFNFIYAAVVLALYFAVTNHPAMLFFALFAPLNLCEGLLALYPIELPAGATDGEFALGLIKKRPEAEVALRVMTAQGMSYTQKYDELPRELLFGAPVVREDSTSFLALLQLQWRTLLCAGEDGALRPLLRLDELFDYIPEESRGEAASDFVAAAVLFGRMDLLEKYSALRGERGTGAQVAAYALDSSDEREAHAAAAAARERLRGEREYYALLISLLKNKKPPQGGVE